MFSGVNAVGAACIVCVEVCLQQGGQGRTLLLGKRGTKRQQARAISCDGCERAAYDRLLPVKKRPCQLHCQ